METKRMREQKNLELAAVQKLSVDIDSKTNECIKQRELKETLEYKEKDIQGDIMKSKQERSNQEGQKRQKEADKNTKRGINEDLCRQLEQINYELS
jgi:hypothetical protein